MNLAEFDEALDSLRDREYEPPVYIVSPKQYRRIASLVDQGMSEVLAIHWGILGYENIEDIPERYRPQSAS